MALAYSPIFKKMFKVNKEECVYQIKRTVRVNQHVSFSSSDRDTIKAEPHSMSNNLALPLQMPVPIKIAAAQDVKDTPMVAPVVIALAPLPLPVVAVAPITPPQATSCRCACSFTCRR